MSEILSFIILAVVFGIIGGLIGWIYFSLKNKGDKNISKVLGDPKLLLAELQKHGKIIDVGKDGEKQEVKYTLEADPVSGKENVVVRRVAVVRPKVPGSKKKPKKKRTSKKRSEPKETLPIPEEKPDSEQPNQSA